MPVAAQIAVANATMYYDKLYSYTVPDELASRTFVGSMVLVPFGRGAMRPRMGVVVGLEEVEQVNARWKELYDVAPEEASLTSELLAIVNYLRQATFCTWYEAVKAVIPYGAQYKPVQQDGIWTLQKQLSRHTEPVFSLTSLGEEALQNGAFVTLQDGSSKKISAKQQLVLQTLQEKSMSRNAIMEECNVGRSVADTLLKYELLSVEELDKQLPEQAAEGERPVQQGPPLSIAQQEISNELMQRMELETPKPALLHGITGSGKTVIFLELVRKALASGKTALVLVPEIGLTPQMLRQLRQSFGNRVAVQHSGLSNTERLLQWRQIQRGDTPVVVGTRSAVFAPLEKIGVIVVDEEQERSYQSESAPRYDAIEVAKRRATHHGALLLLASATPSVADYFAAKAGRYELFTLRERYGNMPLPAVEIVDMQQELALGNMQIISERMGQEISKNLREKSQTILLLNRRGYHRVGVCRSCGEVLKCSECSVPMVFHKNKQGEAHLLCHYCGKTTSPVPDVCPACGGEIRYAGFGTQRMEEELAQRFPEARVLRMDMDTTGRKGAHAKMLGQFEKGEYDIMIGTQMVAKGLDFEGVSLVGVIGIDSLLFSQGYRAFETVFSLVTQVVGRSGRANKPGRALIQTVDPENPVLNLAAQQDYEAFYNQEIGFRKMALYPPFCALCMVGFVSKEETDTVAAARRFAILLGQYAKQQPDIPLRILGPAPMNVVQVAGSFRYRLTLKCRNDNGFRLLINRVLGDYNKEGWPRKTSVYLDFNTEAGI